MTAFFMMYLINNEYTAKGEQPIQGILCLDDKDAAAKLHYLAREWQYFPGKLLTPEMLKKDPGYYSCYISIGERNEMELGNEEASTYGCSISAQKPTVEEKSSHIPLYFQTLSLHC